MDPAISDLALDLGQFALDNELEKERKRTQQNCKARSEANRLCDDLVTISGGKEFP